MLDEHSAEQLRIDSLTGQATAIGGPVLTAAGRAACAALNRQRAVGILALSQYTPSSQPIPINVWAATLTRGSREWQVPLISLDDWGFVREEEGLRCPDVLVPLTPGAEAAPYLHRESGMVYKLFDVRFHGGLGKKIVLEPGENGDYELKHRDATLLDTMEKIQILHKLGAHATEIVGLDAMGNFLIVKQPLAEFQPYNSVGYPESAAYRLFEKDRTAAINAIRGEICRGPGLREPVVVGFVDDQAWLVADLHHRNIMRDADGNPTIIDALTGSVTPSAYQKLPWLADAVGRAREWRHHPHRPKNWSEDFEEDEI